MLNIVIPMAGLGSRFAAAGYLDPKPLISVHGVAMIQLVIENLRPQKVHRFIFICQSTHVKKYNLAEKLKLWAPNSMLIQLDAMTDGAARTVLAAQSLIDNDSELMIANSDQYCNMNINDYLNKMETTQLDGLVMTMKAYDPKWSFAVRSRLCYAGC